MTRTADTDNNLANRVAYAKKFNPDVFVSIHINAVGGQHGGAEVYYPNGNYIPGIGTEGKELAEVIQQKLVALGYITEESRSGIQRTAASTQMVHHRIT